MSGLGGWHWDRGDFSKCLADELVASRVISGEVPTEIPSITKETGESVCANDDLPSS